MEELESMREIYDFPPELDFCSDSFDPVCALNSYIHLPFPNAKTYNNLAEYYSHTFLKKDDRKRVEKDRPYDRDYSFYYATLGIDRNAQERYERRRVNRIQRMKYAGWRTAKLKKKLPKLDDDPNREPCRSYPPLQSTKIIKIETALSKRKIFPTNNPQDNYSEMNLDSQLNNFMENAMKEDGNSTSLQNGKRPPENSNINSGQEMQLNDFMENAMKEDRNSESHQKEKKPPGISNINSVQEMRPKISEPSSVDQFVSKNSGHRQRSFENSSYNYRRKHENRYRQHPTVSHFNSRNSYFRNDLPPKNHDPRLRRRERFA